MLQLFIHIRIHAFTYMQYVLNFHFDFVVFDVRDFQYIQYVDSTLSQLCLSSHSSCGEMSNASTCPQLLQDSKQGLQELRRLQGCRCPPGDAMKCDQCRTFFFHRLLSAEYCRIQICYKTIGLPWSTKSVSLLGDCRTLQPTSVQATKLRRSAKRVSGDGRDCSLAVARLPTDAMGARVAASLSSVKALKIIEHDKNPIIHHH